MKLENICEGLVVKNYRQLCELLEVEIKSGKSKQLQLKDLQRYFNYDKDGQKIIITKIFDEPLEKIDKRALGNNTKEFPNLLIESEKFKNYGIYKIVLNEDIYIGSTVAGFKKRFLEHNRGTDKLMKHTYELLQNGAMFEILYDMTGVEDIDLIRMVEDEFIKMYLLDKNWNVINKKKWAKDYNRTYEKKRKIIKISEDKFYDAIQLLAKYGLIDEEGVDM